MFIQRFTPYIDVQILQTFGSQKATNKFAVEGGSVTDAFDSKVADSAMHSAKLGAEVARGNHSFGLNYGIRLRRLWQSRSSPSGKIQI